MNLHSKKCGLASRRAVGGAAILLLAACAAQAQAPAQTTSMLLTDGTAMREVLAFSGPPTPVATAAAPTPNDAAAPLAAREYLALAVKAMSRHDMRGADIGIQNALTLDGQLGRAYYLRGYVELQSRQTAAAATDFSAAIKENPQLGEAYLALGHLEFEAGAIAAARKSYQRAVALLPGWQTELGMALLDVQAKDYTAASRMALQAAGNHSAPPECYYIAARADDARNQLPQAILEYRAYLLNHPRKANAAMVARSRLAQLTTLPKRAAHSH